MDQLLDTLTQRCAVEAAEASRDALAVRVRLWGAAPSIASCGMGPVELELAPRRLQDEAQARGQWWWLESVKAATRPPIDTAALAQSGGLVANCWRKPTGLPPTMATSRNSPAVWQEFNHLGSGPFLSISLTARPEGGSPP